MVKMARMAADPAVLQLLLGSRLAKICSPCYVGDDKVCEPIVVYKRNSAVHT